MREYVYEVVVREACDECPEDDDGNYPRRRLLAKVLSCFIEADFDVKIRFLEPREAENPTQGELGGL